MKNLELLEMETIRGNGCSNASNVVNGVGAVTWAVGALFVASTGGLALFAIAGAAVIGSYAVC